MKRALVLVGTRPEGIKMAPVHLALQESGQFESILVSTGQHREMLQQVLDVFQLKTDRDLGVMTANQTLAGLTSRLIASIDALLDEMSPDVLLVQGDTTSVFAGALCGFYRDIPVAHVEAGLRTGNLRSPFPEEANRVLASRLAALHFAPTDRSRENLLKEGVADSKVFVTGNTVIDALRIETDRQESDPELHASITAEIGHILAGIGRPEVDLLERPYILITGHRRENFGGGFERICDAIRELAQRHPQHRLVYPVHLNPNVNAVVRERLAGLENVLLLPPVPYRLFIHLMRHSHLILTDSGGVQEEAPSLGKPVLVMRDTTERPEGVDAGTVRLVGTETESITAEASRLIDDESAYLEMAQARNPYGDGFAARRILNALEAALT